MLKEKNNLNINIKSINNIFTSKQNPLKYETHTSPVSDSLRKDLDEALIEARNTKIKKYSLKEIFDSIKI